MLLATKNINRLTVIIDHLKIQAKNTDSINASDKSHKMIENNALFSKALFSTDSDKFEPYVIEVETNIQHLSRLLGNNQSAIATTALEKIEVQIQALLTSLNANKTMHDEAQTRLDTKINSIKARQYKQAVQSVIQSSQALYQKLSEHHEFERRLCAMLAEHEFELSNCSSAKRNALSQKVLAVHQRLGRCRKAISIIERDIEFSEKSGH